MSPSSLFSFFFFYIYFLIFLILNPSQTNPKETWSCPMLEISFGVQEAQLEQEILEKFHFFSPVPGVILSPWVSCCCPMEKPLHPPQNSLQTNPKKSWSCSMLSNLKYPLPRHSGVQKTKLGEEILQKFHVFSPVPGLIFITTGFLLLSLICWMSSRSLGLPLCRGQQYTNTLEPLLPQSTTIP